jgi:peroxiredoxin
MKVARIVQLGFLLLAALAVYTFVAMAKDAQARRGCIPLCSMHPAYAGQNRTAPDFELKDLEDRSHRLSQYRGKTVVLNFWTTTCQPCLEELPSLAELGKIVARRSDIVVLTIATDADRAVIQTALHAALQERPPFPVLLDPNLSIVSDRYGTHLYPETWIIDAQGVIRARFDGARDWSDAMVLDLIDSFRLAPSCEVEFLAGKPSARSEEICDDTI